MHREFDPAAEPFERRSAAGLIAFTALLAGLLLADLWPALAAWLGWGSPTWPRDLLGVRFALVAAVLGGARALFTSLDRAWDGRIGADLAVAIAAIAAILIGEPLVAAEVVVIGLIGECLEAATFNRTQRALRSLAELFPQRCWVLRDGVETRVFTSQLASGDHVIVKPGGKIPVDGVVLAGTSAVNAAALTGESLPQDKAAGDAVLAGSINLNGSLTIRADRVAKETLAGRVIDLTAAALGRKAPLERTADRYARRFLPVVFALALAAFAFNLFIASGTWSAAARAALYPALAVLVVACPCPLVLATPAAVIAALGRLAGTGVLLKGGAALERLAEIDRIAFDKTGTLTTGELELGDIASFAKVPSEELLRLAAAIERGSEHPLARMLTAAAVARGLPGGDAADFRAHPGGGVAAEFEGGRFVLGNRRLLEQFGIAIPPAAEAALARFDETGQTGLLLAKDGAVLGAIGARDTLRPEAAGVIDDLKMLGLGVSLLTGDRPAAARAVAARAGIDDVHAELLPQHKAERLSDNPERSAFVGDGVNDAPALARAGVGLAVGTGTDVAAATGDVVLMGEPLRPLPFLIRLSRKAVEIIRQNIVWFGFGVNFVGVVIGGFLWPLLAPSQEWFERGPLFGAIYHQIGSLLVLFNSMRILAFEKPAATRVANFVRDADRWLNTLHFDDLAHEIGHRWKPITAAIAGLLLIGWAASSLARIEANERGLVQRFGAVVGELEPGLNLRWPWPVERVHRVRPDEVQTIELGFRRLPEADAALRQARAVQLELRRGTDQTWASAHAADIQKLSDEGIVLTGDGTLVEVLATLRFRVSDPRAFLFHGGDVQHILRSTLESCIREQAAGAQFEHLLTSDRVEFERRVLRQLAAALPPGLGVALDGLTVHDLHPPAEVVDAYHAVAAAIQQRDRAVNDAEADAIRVRRRAADDALHMVRIAGADAAQRVAIANAERDGFLAWHAIRSKLEPAEEQELARELAARTSAGEDEAAVARDLAGRRRTMLESRRALTELRLVLAAAVQAFAGRDKIIIDADAVPGRRTLFLADPETFRLPALPKPDSEGPP